MSPFSMDYCLRNVSYNIVAFVTQYHIFENQPLFYDKLFPFNIATQIYAGDMGRWSLNVFNEMYPGETIAQAYYKPASYALWSCPSESTPLGKSDEKKFAYSHYAVNGRLTGLYDNASYPFRKVSALNEPTKCLTLIDNGWTKQDRIFYCEAGNVAFRHGGGGGATLNGECYDYTNGKRVNAAYYDGHAATITRDDFNVNGTFDKKQILLEGY